MVDQHWAEILIASESLEDAVREVALADLDQLQSRIRLIWSFGLLA